jgi:hypothetical protein
VRHCFNTLVDLVHCQLFCYLQPRVYALSKLAACMTCCIVPRASCHMLYSQSGKLLISEEKNMLYLTSCQFIYYMCDYVYSPNIVSHAGSGTLSTHSFLLSRWSFLTLYSNTLMYFFIPETSISFLDRTDYAEYNLFNGKILPQFYYNFGKYLTFWQAHVA